MTGDDDGGLNNPEEGGSAASTSAESTVDGSDSFIDEELIPILVVGGVLLFLFPEPVTSTLGLVLVVIGTALWAWDVLRESVG